MSPGKIARQKPVVPLAMRNNLSEKLESARAACVLLDEQGKTAGQATRWVIGGSNTNGLAAGATNAVLFGITAEKPFRMANLTAKVSFSRIVHEGGKLAGVAKHVTVTTAAK